jgi:hypothetical protein
MFWIVGVDLDGTDPEALEFLMKLKRDYARQIDARVFSLGNNAFVFHPKVYWFDTDGRKVVVIGSANATAGGLLRNCETSVELDVDMAADETISEDFDRLWMTYSAPLPPFSAANLLRIDRRLIERMASDAPASDGNAARRHPLAGLPLPSVNRPRRGLSANVHARGGKRRSRYLVMDVLLETRQTQVQLPVNALARFFGTSPAARDTIILHQLYNGRIVKSDERPVVNLENNTHRIELDAIRGLPRPLIVRFGRVENGDFTYEVVTRGMSEYSRLDQLLTSGGSRTREGARRWLIV